MVKNRYQLGGLIASVRKEQKVPVKTLTMGIMTKNQLKNVEKGNLEMEKVIYDFLLMRLGVPELCYEILVEPEELERYILRRDIRLLAVAGKNKEGRKKSNEYKRRLGENSNNIHYFFLGVMEGYFMKTEKEHIGARITHLLQVWYILREEIIQDGIGNRFGEMFLSPCEMELLVLLSEAYLDNGNRKMARMLLEGMYGCIHHHIQDITGQVKIYPLIMWKLAKLECMEKNWKKADKLCKDAIELLIQQGSLRFIIPLLECRTDVLNRLEGILQESYVQDEKNNCKEYLECLYTLFREYNINTSCNYPMTSFENAYLTGEMVKGYRIALGISQISMSEGIMEPESLARIESGRAKIRSTNFRKLMQQMGREEGKTSLLVKSDDLWVQSLYQKIMKKIYLHRYEDARDDIKEMMTCLDQESNEQLCQLLQIIIGRGLCHWNGERIIHSLNNTLKLSIKSYPDIAIEIWPWKCIEALILNYIADQKYLDVDILVGFSLIKRCLNSYKARRVSRQFTDYSQLMLEESYAKLLGKIGMHTEAVELSKKIIEYGLNSGNMGGMGKILYGMAWNTKKIEGTDLAGGSKVYRKYFLQSMCMTKLEQNRYYIDDMQKNMRII